MENSKKKEKLFNVVWMVNGVIKETIETGKSRSLAYWIKKQKENSTHKTGLVLCVEQK